MARRVFLDVGGHVGETLAEVVKPRWRFDRIWTFEPASACQQSLQQLADPRVEVVPAGWWTERATLELHDPGAIGASIVADKALTATVERCRFVDAADWIEQHVREDDHVWLKLNCEGAECDVLDHLLDRGAIGRVDHLLVHFDVEKIPSMADRAAPTRRRLDDAPVEVVEARQIMFGRSHALKTANWLAWSEAHGLRRLRHRYVNRVTYRGRQLLYPLKRKVQSARGRAGAELSR